MHVDADSFPIVKAYFRAESSSGAQAPVFDLKDLKVRENGQGILLTELRSAAETQAAKVALVLDRSASMMDEFLYRFDTIDGQIRLAPTALRRPGEPYAFQQAQLALLRLAASFRRPGDGVFLVSFSDRVDPVLPMQKDTTQIGKTMRTLRATGRTAFHDALMAALDSLEQIEGVKAIVALTDGTDNASRYSAAEVVRQAKAKQTPIYVVGLGNVDRDSLLSIASGTKGGCYFLERGSQLLPVYQDISKRVRRVYCATYRSLYVPQVGEQIHIEVRLSGDSLCMRGHAGRYSVPDHIALAMGRQDNLLRLLGGGALTLLATVLIIYLSKRKKEAPAQPLPSLPISLNPPRIISTIGNGSYSVAIELSGESPTAVLLLRDRQGHIQRQYQCSGHRVVLELLLEDLQGGHYTLQLTDGQSLSPQVDLHHKT